MAEKTLGQTELNIDKHSWHRVLCLWGCRYFLSPISLSRPRSQPNSSMIRQEEIITSKGLHSTETGYLPGAVLLAEDDPALRRYLEVVLQRAGYRVLSAGDGLEAMKLLLESNIEAVVTDAMMPNLNGHELCRFVRTTKHLAHLPIVLLSALDPKNATAEAEQANAFLCKPVSPESLLECLGELGIAAH